MRADWTLIAAWIGSLGGLSGFATLLVTWWWRHRDRKQVETERIAVRYVNIGPLGLSFWVSFDAPEKNERVELLAKILGGSRQGPFIEGYRTDTTGLAYEPRETLPPASQHSEVVEPLSEWLNSPIPKGAVGTRLIAHGTPVPREVRVLLRVRGRASGKILAARTLYVAS